MGKCIINNKLVGGGYFNIYATDVNGMFKLRINRNKVDYFYQISASDITLNSAGNDKEKETWCVPYKTKSEEKENKLIIYAEAKDLLLAYKEKEKEKEKELIKINEPLTPLVVPHNIKI